MTERKFKIISDRDLDKFPDSMFEDPPPDPCEHCHHKECINHHDMCCWCGEPMETWT